MLGKINYYFFGEESISWSDALWYYGLNGIILIVGIAMFYNIATM
ncbi:hypothetical protein BN982_04082 [Halobacillus karajensis]|nr:hypothetical protein BN982_04082 [Halobacillus karajensis]